MHELGLAAGIFDLVREHVPAGRAAAVRRVRIRVGEFAGVLPESLVFCFGALTQGTPYGQASLDVERVAGRELRVSDVELDDVEPDRPELLP